MVDEVDHQPDHGHCANKSEEQSDALLVSGQSIISHIYHQKDTNKSERENHPFLHHKQGLLKGFTKVIHPLVLNHIKKRIKLRVNIIDIFIRNCLLRGRKPD